MTDTTNNDEPTTPTREQIKALTAAVSALEIHAESCGHRRHDSLCAYCDDARIAKNARKALALFSQPSPSTPTAEAVIEEGTRIQYRNPEYTQTVFTVRRVMSNLGLVETHGGKYSLNEFWKIWRPADPEPVRIEDMAPGRKCNVCHGSGLHPRGGTHCPSCLGVGIELS